jgi:hypothetical protein
MDFNSIFKATKPIIGMVHLEYLDGENFKGVDFVVKKALNDVVALEKGGIDGILIENWKEESLGEFVSKETAKNFTAAVIKLSKKIKIPFGINVLNNDYKVAFSVAKLTNASFVEMDVFVDKVRSDFQNNENAIKNPFVINPKPKEIWKYAKSVGAENIPLFVFIQPKHYIILEKNKTIKLSAKQAIENGASAVLVTKATGFAPTANLIKQVKKVANNIPVGIGSGFSIKNAKDFLPIVDFVIVGTSIKENEETDNPVAKNKVVELMRIVRKSRT